jgi:hypothetical protein
LQFSFLPQFYHFFKKFNSFPANINYKFLNTKSIYYKTHLFSIFLKKGNALFVQKLFFVFFNFFSKYYFNSFGLLFFHSLNTAKSPSFKSVIMFFLHIISFFMKTKFIFFFFFEKLNKRLYKYAKYKKPRYSIKYIYTPPFKRFQNLLNFFKRSAIYFNEITFKARFFKLLFMFFTSKKELFFFNYTSRLQAHIFKKKLLMPKR